MFLTNADKHQGSDIRSLMKVNEMVLETSVSYRYLTRLTATKTQDHITQDAVCT